MHDNLMYDPIVGLFYNPNDLKDIANYAYRSFDTLDLMRIFVKREGYYFSTDFFSVNSRQILMFVGTEDFNSEVHNHRKEEWTSEMHEKRIALLIHNHSRTTAMMEPIELGLQEVESNLYDLQIIDGGHRLIASYLLNYQQVLVKMKDAAAINVAAKILIE